MKLLQYALVAYVRNSVGDWLDGLRRELHPQHAHLPAHLSILPPRCLQGSEYDAIELVENVCETVQPFEITLGEVENFFPITSTVFLRVAHAAYRMRELHDRLNVGALRAEEQWPYMPHLTIFKMDDLAQAQTAFGMATQRWADYRGSRRVRLQELTFVREAGENRWVDLAPVPLGRRLAESTKH